MLVGLFLPGWTNCALLAGLQCIINSSFYEGYLPTDYS